MKILGIDPGSRIAGYGVLDVGGVIRHLDHGVLDLTKCGERLARLAALAVDLRELIRDVCPDVISIELAHIIPGQEGSGLVIAESRGVVLGVAGLECVDVVEYRPAQAKQAAAGKGNAPKPVVRAAIERRFGIVCKVADSADALALAYAHAIRVRGSAEALAGERPGAGLPEVARGRYGARP